LDGLESSQFVRSDVDDTVDGNITFTKSITVNGNVGIGTNSPSYKLHVAGGDINIDDGRALRQNGRWVMGSNSTLLSIGSMSATDGRDIGFYIGSSTPSIYISKSTGNVGIGTTNPLYKLDVTGDIRATGTI